MNAKPTLLIVSYYFAPNPAVGAKRFSFLAREFVALGYDVHIVTNAHAESPHGRADTSLPLAGHVHRVAAAFELPLAGTGFLTRKFNSLLRRLFAPVGLEYFWARAATRKALEIARELPPGVVIATSPPHAALLAGARIARALNWPLILDYRDPWSAHEWPKWRRGRLAQWCAQRLEAPLVLESAARILNTAVMRRSFERFFPRAPGATNYVIPNGFDALAAAPPPPGDGALEIVHAGEIFSGRSLVPVLTAARALQLRTPSRKIRLTTYGALPPAELRRIRDAGLKSFINVQPRVPFDELRARLQAAHVLLAVVGDHMLYSAPYKVYDYMAAGRPILGLAPCGAALFALLNESGTGICVEPGDAPGIEAALAKLLYDPPADTALASVERYRWSNLALQYRAVIEEIAAPDAAVSGRDALAPAG